MPCDPNVTVAALLNSCCLCSFAAAIDVTYLLEEGAGRRLRRRTLGFGDFVGRKWSPPSPHRAPTELTAPPPTWTSARGQKMERRQQGERASSTVRPWGPLPVYLFQDCYLINERGGGLDPLTPRQFSAFYEPPGALKLRADARRCAYICMMQNLFFFPFLFLEKKRKKTKPCRSWKK